MKGKLPLSKREYVNQRFGQLTIVENPIRTNGSRFVTAKCDCGTVRVFRLYDILKKDSTSCGCVKIAMLKDRVSKHQLTQHKLYRVWCGIKERCNNPNHDMYIHYGQRGINICEQWANDFPPFYNWAISNGWIDGLTIDRVNNDLGYSPENCRMATRTEQQRNKRTNNMVTFQNRTQCLSAWAEELRMNYNVLRSRLRIGWTTDRALTTPIC